MEAAFSNILKTMSWLSDLKDQVCCNTRAIRILQQGGGGGTYLAGNGLTLTGDTFSINTLITADLTTAQTLTNKYLFSARANQFVDANGNELLIFLTSGAAVNEVSIGNAATGVGPAITASGGDTNVDLNLSGQNAGVVRYKTFEVGFRIVPSNVQTANYTTVLEDNGKSIDHPASDNNARLFSIDDSVAYPIGTCISGSNMAATAGTVDCINGGTMYLAGTGTTGTRTVPQYCTWTARKVLANTWLISGVGLT
jgi:hypothetical protein